MELLDHKEHILGQITRQADREVQKREQEHKEQLQEFKTALSKKTKQQLQQVKHDHEKVLRRLQRQYDSTLSLQETQQTLEKQGKLISEVRARLSKILKGEELQRIVTLMVERLRAAGGKTFVVPKGISLPDCTPEYDEVMVTAKITENEELEIHLTDLVHEHHKTVHDIIEKGLFS